MGTNKEIGEAVVTFYKEKFTKSISPSNFDMI